MLASPSASARARRLLPALLALGPVPAGAFALLLAAPAAVHAQVATGTIAGRIQNVDTGSFVLNARVTVEGTKLEAFTDVGGEYRISNVPAGPVTLKVSYTGMQVQTVTATVAAGQSLQQDISLSQVGKPDQNGVVQLQQFVVQGERETNAAAIALNEQRYAANRKDVISTDAFGDINQGNIGEFVKFVPGISLDVKDGNSPSGIMIRGFDPNYTNVTMDGGALASTQIANTQTSSRQFLLEQANINNLARIEVTKLPTPDQSANLLGGSVNFVSKSAFERSKPELRAQIFLSGNSNDLKLGKNPGPGAGDQYHVRPNFDMTYVNPLSRTLGIVLNFAQSSQYYLQNKAVPGRRYFTGTAGQASFVSFANNPQTTSMNSTFAPNRLDRTSGSITVDWKPFERNVLSFTAQANANYQQQASRSINYSIGGGNPVSWDEHNTFGSTGTAGTGSAGMSNSFQNRNGLLRAIGGRWNYNGADWKTELAGTYSNSNNRVRDTSKGFWNGISTSLPNVKTVNLIGIDNSSASVAKTQVLDANGNAINELNLGSYNLGKVTSQPADNQDTVKDFRGSVSRSFDVRGIPVSLKLGGSYNGLIRDQKYTLTETTYAGPDGVLNSGDEQMVTSQVNFIDTSVAGTSPGFGRPGAQWPDPYKIYQTYLQHPNWFVRSAGNDGDTIKNYAVRSPLLMEDISAGYIMADTKLLNNRLRLVGGVRYEYTKDAGYSYKQDGNAIYQKDAQGHPIKNAAGTGYVLLPSLTGTVSGGPEQNALTYIYRGSFGQRDYAYYFPSVHATFNITENLLLRAAFAKTMGRPNISDVVPTVFVGDNINFGNGQSNGVYPGSITGSNSTLRPWTAKNYDYTLEYYLPHNGQLMFNWYKKDIRDFFSTVNQVADIPLLDSLGLSHDYVGYQYSTRINISDAMIKGWEIGFSNFSLQNLTSWGPLERFDPIAKHFFLMANATHLELSGSRVTASDWKRYIPRSRNFGLRFAYPKVSGNILLNWKGKMLRDTSTLINGVSSGGSEYIRARYQLDGNLDYQVTKRYAVFIAARNLLNAPTEWEVAGPNSATYDAMTNYEKYGVQYSLGVRGNF